MYVVIGDVGVVDAIGAGESLLHLDLTGCTGIKNFRDLILMKVGGGRRRQYVLCRLACMGMENCIGMIRMGPHH